MRGGKNRKPVQVQIAEGDPRGRGVHKLDEQLARLPGARRGLPDPPKHLVGLAKRQWFAWREELQYMDLDFSADAAVLEAACVNYARAVQADETLRKFRRCECKEELLDKVTGEVLAIKLRNHPAVARSNASWKQCIAALCELGLTLQSRQRLAIDLQAVGEDADIAELLLAPRESKVPEPIDPEAPGKPN